MGNGFFKIFFLCLLAAGLAVVVVMMQSGYWAGGGESDGGQSFLEQFVIAGGPIVWFILLPMSLVTVFLAVELGLTIRRKRLLGVDVNERIVEIVREQGIGQLAKGLEGEKDFVSIAVADAVTKGRGDWFRMRSVVGESLQDQALGLMRKIEWLSLIGNVSPMVGLFGTVYGMIKLFNVIVVTGGQPQPTHLAGGISLALVTTFWGLFIAIPALAIHGIFRNRIESLVSEAVTQADSVMPEIRRSLKKKLTETESIKKTPIREMPSKTTRTVRVRD